MKLLRYGDPGAEKPGLLDSAGGIRDLSGEIADIDGAALDPAVLRRLAALDPGALPRVDGSPRLGACIARPGKFVAIGLNFTDHAIEAGMPIPAEPEVFFKADTCICGPYDDIVQPPGSSKLDYEIELALVIGSRLQYADRAAAAAAIAGYCVTNDISERVFQIDRGGTQWSKGKSCDTFGPTGPWLVTPDEIDDVQNLGMWLEVNGQRRQTGSSATMVFDCVELARYVSQFMTLMPGDIVTTGTPPGVALGHDDPPWLRPGDELRFGIDGLGEQRHTVVAHGAV